MLVKTSLLSLSLALVPFFPPALCHPTAISSTSDQPGLIPRGQGFTLPDIVKLSELYGAPENDFSCKLSPAHPNPVILLHGLSANNQVDLNMLQKRLKEHGYCTFSLTYGAYDAVPWIGGVEAMESSADEIAAFVREVHSRTGARRVDCVGHSEGGVMTAYVPKIRPDIAPLIEHTVALGPALHGARYFGFTDLWYIGGDFTRQLVSAALTLLGCPACDDMAEGGAATKRLNDGAPMVQPGVKASIIVSTADTLVPPEKSIITGEKGTDGGWVRTVYVQDKCPEDRVGHAGLMWDKGVWGLVENELTERFDDPIQCDKGITV